MTPTRLADIRRLLTSIGTDSDAINRLTDSINAARAGVEKLINEEIAEEGRQP